MQHCWLGHCKVLNSPMTPTSRLTCPIQIEGAVHAVPLVPGRNLLFLYLFWYLVFVLPACAWSDGVCSRFVVISVR